MNYPFKYNFLCCQREFKRICKAIPLPLIILIKNIWLYSNVKAVLPSLVIGKLNLSDRKFNKLIGIVLKSRIYHDYHREARIKGPDSAVLSITHKAFYKFIKWPVSPKVKETHFKIINVYPTAAFLHKRFGFEVDPCHFCGECEETLEHVFFMPLVPSFLVWHKKLAITKSTYHLISLTFYFLWIIWMHLCLTWLILFYFWVG